MATNYIALAIPVFFLLIGVEILVAYWQKKSVYSFQDSINDLSAGIYQQVASVFLNTFLFVAYVFLYNNIRIFEIKPQMIWAWLLCFLLYDMLYYWFHRASHEIAFIWGSHEPHHSSEEYNLTVALRQGMIQSLFSFPFYLPLAVIGFPPLMVLTLGQFNTLYQFWIHTRLIKTLGPLEYILNTPSHHRVHHGKNPKYIDKNHGGTFIIWDKLFGTFQKEEEEPVYGTVKPLASWNPVWAQFQYWLSLFSLAKQCKNFADKIKVFFMPPGWKPEELGGRAAVPEISAANFLKFQLEVPTKINIYILLQFVFVIPLLLALLGRKNVMHWQTWVLAITILVTLLIIGGFFERRKWSFYLEHLRLFAIAGFLFYIGLQGENILFFWGVAIIFLSFFFWSLNFRRYFAIKSL